MIITFLGATGTVTGSKFLVESGRNRVLLDCGLFQGLGELRRRNWEPLGEARGHVDVSAIDAVVLTHAHLDHCGYLPRLVADGFQGPVYATPSTIELVAIVLADSAHLQQEEAALANRLGYSKHRPARPLYSAEDAERAIARLRPVEFDTPTEIAPGFTATFRPAGHILGSAVVELRADGAPTVVASGDLGRGSHPVLVAPAPLPSADALLLESTYGDRVHDDTDAQQRFRDAVTATIERGGRVVIPAFAVDRTEVVLALLGEMQRDGELSKVPIYVDSPMALAAMAVYERAIEERRPDVRPDAQRSLLSVADVVEVRDPGESARIDTGRESRIIVSASGMATGGRVLHHLEHMLGDTRSTVILPGFQAVGTRGRRLLEGERVLKMHGKYVPVRAHIVDATGLSVHADRNELVGWVRSAAAPPEMTYVVHGEPASSRALAEALGSELGLPAVVPRHGERVVVT